MESFKSGIYPVKSKGQWRKQQITDAAKAMFMEKGYQNTHIGELCERLKIARGTVYQYFNNKKEIIYNVVDNVKSQVEVALDFESLKSYLSAYPIGDIKEIINKRLFDCVKILIGEPIMVKLIFKEMQVIDGDIIAYVNKAVETIVRDLAEEITMLQKMNYFRSDLEPFMASNILVGGVMMAVYQYNKKGVDISSPDITEAVTMQYLNGVIASK